MFCFINVLCKAQTNLELTYSQFEKKIMKFELIDSTAGNVDNDQRPDKLFSLSARRYKDQNSFETFDFSKLYILKLSQSSKLYIFTNEFDMACSGRFASGCCGVSVQDGMLIYTVSTAIDNGTLTEEIYYKWQNHTLVPFEFQQFYFYIDNKNDTKSKRYSLNKAAKTIPKSVKFKDGLPTISIISFRL